MVNNTKVQVSLAATWCRGATMSDLYLDPAGVLFFPRSISGLNVKEGLYLFLLLLGKHDR